MMLIILWIAQVILLIMYGMAGILKTFQVAKVKGMMPWAKDRSNNYIRFIGISELLGALGMLLPVLTGILTILTPLAGLGLTIIQVLAIFTEHLPKKEYKAIPMNVVLLLLSLFVFIGRLWLV